MSTLVYSCRQIITDGELSGEFSVDRLVEKSVEGRCDGGNRGAPGQYPPGQGSRAIASATASLPEDLHQSIPCLESDLSLRRGAECRRERDERAATGHGDR